ncbi:immunity protein 35 of polymorphic toxin system [Streptomyces sp. TLI_235]|nr:YrhB domain-containing protein [Streptomyces sp. TLI_235]PBC75761.1 immunity protein 35 of polymorphic toxin system [Streptomyces sp. TLI_235]
MITKEHAVELVESELARERETDPWMARQPAFAVYRVEERAVGWLVFWESVVWMRSRDRRDTCGVGGPYLVDRQDGSLHFIRATSLGEDWETFYRRRIRGGTDDDPLVVEIRGLLQSAGPVAAMRQLRRLVPRLGIGEAKAYVAAVAQGVRPPAELVQLTWPDDPWLSADIMTVTGPAGRPLP